MLVSIEISLFTPDRVSVRAPVPSAAVKAVVVIEVPAVVERAIVPLVAPLYERVIGCATVTEITMEADPPEESVTVTVSEYEPAGNADE